VSLALFYALSNDNGGCKDGWKRWRQANRMVNDAVTPAHALCGGENENILNVVFVISCDAFYTRPSIL